MKNNKPHGDYKIYYQSGILKEEGCYDNGKKHGMITTYNEAGKCKFVDFHCWGGRKINGNYEKITYRTEFDTTNNNLLSMTRYENDNMDTWTKYNPEGRPTDNYKKRKTPA